MGNAGVRSRRRAGAEAAAACRAEGLALKDAPLLFPSALASA